MEIPLGKLAFDAPYSMSQIGTLQCLYYLVLCVLLQAAGWLRGEGAEMGQVFVVEERADIGMLVMIHCMAAVATGYFVHMIAERSRKCLDQSATIYVTHFVICTLLLSFPASSHFYFISLLSFVLTFSISRYLCTRSEQAEVTLDRRKAGTPSSV